MVIPMLSNPTHSLSNRHQTTIPRMPMTGICHLSGEASVFSEVMLGSWHQLLPTFLASLAQTHGLSSCPRLVGALGEAQQICRWVLIRPLPICVNVQSLGFLIWKMDSRASPRSCMPYTLPVTWSWSLQTEQYSLSLLWLKPLNLHGNLAPSLLFLINVLFIFLHLPSLSPITQHRWTLLDTVSVYTQTQLYFTNQCVFPKYFQVLSCICVSFPN